MKSEEKKSEVYILKWITIGCLGVLTLITVFLLSLLWYFSPLLSVEEDKVSFLGGLFTLEEGVNSFFHSQSSAHWHHYDEHFEEGSYRPGQKDQQLKLEFSQIKADLVWTKKNKITWKCSSKRQGFSSHLVEQSDPGLLLSLKAADKCDVQIPQGLKLVVEAENGKIFLKEPRNSYEVDMKNGLLSIDPHPKTPFHYDFQVTNGVIGSFEGLHSDDQEAKKAKVRLGNGSILREN